MTIRSVVIAQLSVFAHIRILGPLQAVITCAYIVHDWNSVQVRQSRALHIFNIYVCTDVSSLANVSYLYDG